jgi:predicted ATP-dependent protease
MGALVTDFTLIKPGALHRANGGVLILDARYVLLNPGAWDGLKRALKSEEIKIESLAEMYSLLSTVSLEPRPIELDVKVVIVGPPLIYYLLRELDPDFAKLFKVAADFDTEMDWSGDNQELYARMIAGIAAREGLLPLERGAVGRIIEHAARLVEDKEKLTTHMQSISDLIKESDFWAREDSSETVSSGHVQRAIDSQTYRSDRIRERIQEEIHRGTLLIDTEGEKAGQINGLSVLKLGDFAFGRPNRITARVRLGGGEVLNIEREVELSGPIHSKGVLILSSFLGSRYTLDKPLSLAASLVFEQSYGGIEGDSASSAELFALISGISRVPLKQSLAVTGSVNQHGEIQAIGGVNEKIEGFFDICRRAGLNGHQGVIIPEANVAHLMLRQDVIQAAGEGTFHIYPIRSVDQGLELLTGMPAGEADANNIFPADTVNGRVQKQLTDMAEQKRSFSSGQSETQDKK